MEPSKVLRLFENPLEESWSSQSMTIAYHGGVAVITEESFNYSDNSPELTKLPIGYNTPNGTYFFKHGASNSRDLYTFMVKVYQKGHPDTAMALKQTEDRLRKNPLFLGRALAL